MSLFFANLFGFLVLHKRIVLYCVLGLVVLGGVLFGIDRCSNWRTNRQIDKARANLNAATQELKQAHANLESDKIDEAVKIEKVKEAGNNVANAIQTTEAGKVEIQKATANLANVIAANKPSGVNEMDLQKRLDDLDIK